MFSSENLFVENIATKIDTNGWIDFKPLGIFEKGDLFEKYKTEMGLSNDDEMLLVSSEDGNNNDQHNRYKQFYKGIPVECGNLIEHFRNCQLVTLNGKFVCGLSIDVNPKLTKGDAINVALNDMNANIYMWNDSIAEREIKETTENPNATYYPDPELVIDCSNNLVYLFNINSLDSIFEYRINANSGLIDSKINPMLHCRQVEREPNITVKSKKYKPTFHTDDRGKTITSDQITFGHTLFEGIQSLKTSWTANCWHCTPKHRLKANNYSSKIETRDNEGSLNISNWKREVTMSGISNTTWPISEVLNTQTHWAVQKSYEYFKYVQGNSIYAGKGTIKVKANCGFEGAFFYAAPLSQSRSLYFGHRDGFYLGILDVAGHEFTHLAVDEKSELAKGHLYSNSESRSLHESFADIFGTMIEREYRPSGWDWIFEDEAVPLRNVRNPELSGALSSTSANQPVIYHGLDWNFDLYAGPHSNGGVQNKWFSLLALGGTHNGITVQAIGIDNAAKITWNNILYYIERSSRFIDSRNGAVNSAIDLFGECSFEHAQTQLAWEAVGLGQAENCFVQSGWPIICQNEINLPISITINNSLNQNLTWTPIQIDYVQPPHWNIHTNTTNWNYVTSGINNEVLTIIDIPNNTSLGSFNLFKYSDENGKTGFVNFYIWDCPGLTDPNPKEVFNYCKPDEVIQLAKIGNKKMELKITPNPVVEELKIEGVAVGDHFTIYNMSGKEFINGTIDSQGIVSVSSIPTGLYYINISNNRNQKSKYGKFIKAN